MEYLSIGQETVTEVIVKKSRFIALAAPAEDEKTAGEIISMARTRWPGATHYCYAYVIRSPQRIERYSDDGEPSGTAGVPILEVIKRNNLQNVVVVVVRYFGGTLLGAAGLIRTYTDASVQALNHAQKKQFKLCRKITVECSYNYLGTINNRCLSSDDLFVEHIEYGSSVIITVYIPVQAVDAFISKMNVITNGTALSELLDSKYICFN